MGEPVMTDMRISAENQLPAAPPDAIDRLMAGIDELKQLQLEQKKSRGRWGALIAMMLLFSPGASYTSIRDGTRDIRHSLEQIRAQLNKLEPLPKQIKVLSKTVEKSIDAHAGQKK
jgi:hypothetical protein